MPQSRPLSMGMDVHKDSSAVASVAQDLHAEVSYLSAIGTRQGDLDQLLWKMQSNSMDSGALSIHGSALWRLWLYAQVVGEEPLDLLFGLRRGLRVTPTRMPIIGAWGEETVKPMGGSRIYLQRDAVGRLVSPLLALAHHVLAP
jgi:hypothetical protein